MTTDIQTTSNIPDVQSDDDFAMLMNEMDKDVGWLRYELSVHDDPELSVHDDPPTHVVDAVIAAESKTDTPPTKDQEMAKTRFDSLTSDAIQEVNTTFQRMCVTGDGNLINSGSAEIAGLKFLAGNKEELMLFMTAYDMRKKKLIRKNDEMTEKQAADADAGNNTIALGRKLYVGLQALKSIAKYNEYSEENMKWMRDEITELQAKIAEAQAKLDDENTPFPLHEAERARIRMCVQKIKRYEKLMVDDPELDDKDQPSYKADKYAKAVAYVATNFSDCGTYNRTWADVQKRISGKIRPAEEPIAVREARAKKFEEMAKVARAEAAKAEEEANALLPQTHHYRLLVSECNALKEAGGVQNLVRAAELECEIKRYWSDKYLLARHSVQVCNQRANEYTELAHALIPPKTEQKEKKVTKFYDNEGRAWHLKCLAEASSAVEYFGDVVRKFVVKRGREVPSGRDDEKPKKPKTNKQLSDEAWDKLLRKDLRPGVKRMLERKRELQRLDDERIAQQARLHKANLREKEAAAAEKVAEQARYEELKAAEEAEKARAAAEDGPLAMFRQQLDADAAAIDERNAALRDATRVKRVRNAMTREIHAITNRPHSLARILDDPKTSIPMNVDAELATIDVFESEDSQSSFKPIKNVPAKAKAK